MSGPAITCTSRWPYPPKRLPDGRIEASRLLQVSRRLGGPSHPCEIASSEHQAAGPDGDGHLSRAALERRVERPAVPAQPVFAIRQVVSGAGVVRRGGDDLGEILDARF